MFLPYSKCMAGTGYRIICIPCSSVLAAVQTSINNLRSLQLRPFAMKTMIKKSFTGLTIQNFSAIWLDANFPVLNMACYITTSVSLPPYNALTIFTCYSNISNSLVLEVQPVCKNDNPETKSADEGILSLSLANIYIAKENLYKWMQHNEIALEAKLESRFRATEDSFSK